MFENTISKALIAGIRFIPEAPYNQYEFGYAYFNKSIGRNVVKLWNIASDSSGTSLARYIYNVNYYKQFSESISDTMEVDHINDDRTDDRLKNLQLLTGTMNTYKARIVSGSTCAVLLCPICQQKFIREYWSIHINTPTISNVTCCSRICGTKFTARNISSELITYISKHQILYIIRKHWANTDNINDLDSTIYLNTEGNYILGNRGLFTCISYIGSRQLLSEDCTKCKDIPGITEYCWDILTPIEEQIETIREMLNSNNIIVNIATKLNIDLNYVNKFIKKYLYTDSDTERIKRRNIKIFELLKLGTSKSDIAKLFDIDESNIRYIIKRYG